MENNTLKAGDLVPDGGKVMYSDDAEKTIWLVRQGDKMEIITAWKSLTALFDANAEEAAEFSRSGKHGDIVKVASIPKGLHAMWRAEGILDDKEALRRRLNDSDYSKFRTNSWSL